MTITPDGLYGIAPHGDHAGQLKGFGGEGRGRVFINVAHDVGFALAARTGAAAAELFQGDETFGAICPFNGEFLADLLDIEGAHQCFLIKRSKAARVSGLT